MKDWWYQMAGEGNSLRALGMSICGIFSMELGAIQFESLFKGEMLWDNRKRKSFQNHRIWMILWSRQDLGSSFPESKHPHENLCSMSDYIVTGSGTSEGKHFSASCSPSPRWSRCKDFTPPPAASSLLLHF